MWNPFSLPFMKECTLLILDTYKWPALSSRMTTGTEKLWMGKSIGREGGSEGGGETGAKGGRGV